MGAGAEARLHGHSYRADIVVSGECDAHLGWLMDYADMTERFHDIYQMIDHHRLEDVEGLEDTSLAGIEGWLSEQLKSRIDGLKDVQLSIVGHGSFENARLEPDARRALGARTRFGFEAAHALPNVPLDHKCRRMHGHSFSVEIGAESSDRLPGAVKALYERLDRSCLNEIDGLENPTSEMLSRWIWERLLESEIVPEVVVVAETCTARCVYHGQ